MSRIIQAPGPSFGGRQEVFLATPAYSGLTAEYAGSLFSSATALHEAGISAQLHVLAANCHVDDSRNAIVRDFLNTDCTDLVFLDADVQWSARDLVKLVQHDADVVAGIYPYKRDGMGFPVFHGEPPYHARPDGLLAVEAVPTGFLRIRRSVLETLAGAARTYRAVNDSPNDRPIPLIFERGLFGQVRVGGDYNFCRKWRKAGGEVLIDPEMELGHVGTEKWSGTLGAELRRLNGVSLVQVVSATAEGRETAALLREAVQTWGNEDWSAGAELLHALIALVRDTEGPVLECGSGLSTLLMAAATALERPVLDLETEEQWADRVMQSALSCKLSNVTVQHTGIEGGRYDAEGSLGGAGLIFIDGPARDECRDREPAFRAAAKVALPGAAIVVDDAHDPEIAAQIERLGNKLGTTFHTFGAKRFAVARLPADERGSAA